jgi:type II secretory ATPase GspE/PulE/Tfp pilus assembly ATPase PilB-like protein
MIGVVAQRLVRTICPSCKIDYTPSKDELLTLFGQIPDEEIKLKRGKGCGECGYTGYRGRTGIFEILPVTEKLKDLIKARESTDVIRFEAEKIGMIPLLTSGFEKVKEGIITIEEVLRVIRMEE